MKQFVCRSQVNSNSIGLPLSYILGSTSGSTEVFQEEKEEKPHHIISKSQEEIRSAAYNALWSNY